MDGLRQALDRAVDWIYPRACLMCGDRCGPARDVCDPCRDELPRIGTACPRCGTPGPSDAECGRCLRRAPHFDRTLALFRYATPVDGWIQTLKFGRKLHVARSLGELLAENACEEGGELPECLIPVPLHRDRLRERGFNQSLEIARVAGRALGVPVDWSSSVRIRPTPPQAGLRYDGRRANVRGAFHNTRPVRYRHIALVDDVMTTGSTVDALARCLRRKSDVEQIAVWVIARAVPRHML